MGDKYTEETKYEENTCENCNYWYYKGIEDEEENLRNKIYEEVYEKIYKEAYEKGYEDGYDRGFHRGKNKVTRFNSWSYSNADEGVLPS